MVCIQNDHVTSRHPLYGGNFDKTAEGKKNIFFH